MAELQKGQLRVLLVPVKANENKDTQYVRASSGNLAAKNVKQRP
jgi:hypothetical protein